VIVRAEGSDLLFITQPEHAALAATMMAAWCADGFASSPRRDAVLLATREHDNGWLPEDERPPIDSNTGRLLDFAHAPDGVKWRVWPRGVEALASSPYAAALVAQHALHIHESNRDDPAWAAFFATMEDLRARCLGASPFGAAELGTDYPFLRMGDLMSLTACTGWPGPLQEGIYELRFDGSHLTVRPDPFSGRDVACSVAARRLPNRRFDTPADAASALSAARPEPVPLVISGP
jgi:hypothetical protein